MLTIADTLANAPGNQPIGAAMQAKPSVAISLLKNGVSSPAHLSFQNEFRSDAFGNWSVQLPWPSEQTPASTWSIILSDGTTYTGTVPQNIAGPLQPSTLVSEYGWTVNAGSVPTAPSTSHPYLSLPDGWDAGWKAAKAASGTTPAFLASLGDSICFGARSSDCLSKSYFPLIRASLMAQYGLYADHWCNSFNATTSQGANITSPPFVLSGTGTTYGNFVPWGFQTGLQPGGTFANATVTFTTPYACTALDIVYTAYGAGTWQYAVDGAAAVTVTNDSTSDMKTIQFTGLAKTTHTIVFNNPSTSNLPAINGVTTYNGATGIGFANHSQPGAQSFGATQDYMAKTWSGRKQDGTAATYTNFPANPHLTLLTMGINDMQNNNIGPANFEYAYRKLVEGIRRGRQGASIMFIIHNSPDPVSGDAVVTWTNADTWELYASAIDRIAHSQGCAVANIHAKWGSTGKAQGFLGTTDSHPIDAGHADIANLLLGVLS